ncbi:uncharacterized protein LOC120072958 [Benincasa hispida]|uniref:uncharacterized protein LOC120072958 n=1 Tax=Benincasa hispida TaxID=102211 RepID=UPI0019006005|nr:uncharacterized protein LOC120072958 [Benincasa hispida]
MEMISFMTMFFLFLLATPSLSSPKGGSENGEMDFSSSSSSSEVYEIDYRGPETHSSHISPPDHSHGRPWINHHDQHQLQPKQPPFKPDPYPLKGSKAGVHD